MRAIVIEDDPAINKQIVTRLKQEGFAVDSASNGKDGLYLIQEYPSDVAIVDLGLPQMSGLEVIRKIRSEGSKLPILILLRVVRHLHTWQGSVRLFR